MRKLKTKALARHTTVASAAVVSFGIVASLLALVSGPAILAGPSDSLGSTSAPDSPGEQVTELPIGRIEPIRTGSDITFPIDAYRISIDDQDLLLRAEHSAIVSCMARFGLSWELPAPNVSPVSYSYDRLFGVVDLDEAQINGYHLPGKDGFAIGGSGVDKIKQADSFSLSFEQDAVASGESELQEYRGETIPPGGCIGEARARVGGDGSLLELTEAAVGFGLEQSDRDPRVLEGFDAWSRCMAKSGFAYATPWDANNDPQWSTAAAASREIDVAVADVSCKNATNLTGLRVAVATAWQNQFIADHEADFALTRRNSASQRANAISILAGDD